MPSPRLPPLKTCATANRPRVVKSATCLSSRVQSTSTLTTSTSTSSSSTSRPAKPPYIPPIRDSLASLSADASLLTGEADSTPHPRDSRFFKTPRFGATKAPSLSRPVLKTNTYAGSYVVTEDDLGETIGESVDPAEAPLAESARPQALTSPTRGRRRPHLSSSRFMSKGAGRTSKSAPEEFAGPFVSSSGETVHVHPGYITYQHPSSHTPSIVTFTRLRDSCQCKLCRDPSTRQKTYTTGQAYREGYSLAATSFEYSVEPKRGGEAIVIDWSASDGDSLAPIPPHKSFFSFKRLRRMCGPANSDRLYGTSYFSRTLWGQHDGDNLFVEFGDLAPNGKPCPEVLFKLLAQLQTRGIVFLRGVPTDPTSNESCTLRTVANMIGEIRNTFYGETWDVKSVKQSKNVAYTDLDLGLHMDLLYFASPPRFQLLHCLRNRVNGGLSYFVDSFKVAHDLSRELPETFRLLQNSKISYVYDNDDHFLQHRHPVIDPKFDLNYPHTAVNWSPPFRGPGEALPAKVPRNIRQEARDEQAYYRAINEFEKRLGFAKYRIEHQLKEGDMVLFDNRRVLHARTAFHDKTEEQRKAEGIEVIQGEPTRWLKGCYLDGEVVWDKLAILRRLTLANARKVDG